MKPSLRLLIAAACLQIFTSCGDPDTSKDRADGKLSIFVSVPPQAGFVEAIGGDRVVVASLAGEGQDPHQISIQPKRTIELLKSHAYFTVGMPFEENLLKKIRDHANAPQLVDTTAGVKMLEFEGCEHDHDHDHDHGEDGHTHEHGEADPHIWLSPSAIKVQAATIAMTLKELAPEHAAEFEANLEEFVAELDALDLSISRQMEPLLGKTFFVYHPAFGYFANEYGLYQEPVETGGQSPTSKALAEFTQFAKAEGAKIIFVQPQFDERQAETVAEEIGGRVVPLDPLAADVLANLQTIADSIADALAESE